MSKFLFNVLLLLCLPLLAIAQDSALDKITKSTCECMTKKNLDGMEQSRFEQEIGLCMVTAATPLMGDLEKEEGITAGDPESFQKIGQKVGTKLATECPGLFQKMMEYYGTETTVESSTTSTILMEDGEFQAVENQQFAIVKIKDGAGRVRDYQWLEYFEGSDQLKTGTEAMKGKKVRVYYIEKELYVPKASEYYKMRVLHKLEWQ